MSSPAPVARLVEREERGARRDGGVGARPAASTEPPVEVTRTSVPSATPMRRGPSGARSSDGARRERRQRRRLRRRRARRRRACGRPRGGERRRRVAAAGAVGRAGPRVHGGRRGPRPRRRRRPDRVGAADRRSRRPASRSCSRCRRPRRRRCSVDRPSPTRSAGRIGSHDASVSAMRAGPSTSSSPCSASGSTTPSRARRSSAASTPAYAGATRAISSCTSSAVSRSKSTPKRSASSAAIRQSAIARAVGRDLAGRRAARGPRGSWRCPPSRPTPSTGRNDVGARSMLVGDERVDRDRRSRTASSARADERAVGEVVVRVGAQEHERVDPAVGRGAEDAGGVEARLVGHAPQRLGEPRRGRRRASPARAGTRA